MRRLAIGALLVLSLAAPASARGVTSSITLNEVDPHLGGPATFTIVMPSKYGCSNGICKSHVELVCSQSGTGVFRDYQGTDVAQSPGFVLGFYRVIDQLGHPALLASDWASGPADCVATLSFTDRRTDVTLATTSFTAAG